jgi:hypothetical protein
MRPSLIACLAGLFLAVAPPAASAADVSGTWTMLVTFGDLRGNPTFVLKQQGDKVIGTFSGALGEAAVTGTVTDSAVMLSFKTHPAGQELDVVYTGTVAGDSMSGKVTFVGSGEGTFAGKRK